MKKLLFLSIVLIGFAAKNVANGQNKVDLSRIQALKIAFLTQKLPLSPDEAQKFWPVYNKYEAEIREVKKEKKGSDDELELDEKLIAIRKKYREDFTKILGKDKANRVFTEEREFIGSVQKELQERRMRRQGAPGKQR